MWAGALILMNWTGPFLALSGKMLALACEICQEDPASPMPKYNFASNACKDLNALINDRIRPIEGIEDIHEIVVVKRAKDETSPV